MTYDGSTPPDHEPLITGPSAKKAGGFPAIRSTLKHMKRSGFGPVSALRVLSDMNQTGGFDCPGCAWPDPAYDERSRVAEYCENGAKALAEEAMEPSADAAFFAAHSVASLTERSDFWLGQQGRIAQPMFLDEGASHYAPIRWDDAFALVAEELRALPDPDEAVFYTSGRTSNEAAFLYQLLVRRYGTNNLPDCSNMCHESSGVALGETLGIGKGSVTLEDLHIAGTIIVIGQNPGTNHPRMLSALQEAKRRGAKIITINPLREPGLMHFSHPQEPTQLLGDSTALTDLYLPVRVGADVPLLKAIMRRLLDAHGEVVDRDFIEKRTSGYGAFIEALVAVDPEEMAALARVSSSAVNEAAALIAAAPNVVACWAMGLTQHENGVENIREVVNLLLLLGSVGKPGAGTCPVRGHSNVQGDRTMGIHERPTAALLDRLSQVCRFAPPREPGLNVVESIEAMLDGRVKVFFAMGGNFVSAAPDTARTAEGLGKVGLTVHVSTKLNRSHLTPGVRALVLPCLGRSERDVQPGGEQFVSVENSMGVVHQSRGTRAPASRHWLSEPRIVARLGEALFGQNDITPWMHLADDYDRVRALIQEVIPGFGRYNARVREPGGFELPNGARTGDFKTSTRRAQFSVNPVPDLSVPEGCFEMMTVRSHDQFNTTIYGLEDRYRGISGNRRVVMMNRHDARALGVASGATVDLINTHGGHRRVAENFRVVPFEIPRGCVATYFPEANVLVPLGSRARRSHTPASKRVIVEIIPKG